MLGRYWSPILYLLLLWQALVVNVFGNDAGAALLFDGVNDYATIFANIQRSAQIFAEDWTIEAWVRPLAPVRQECLLNIQTLSLKNLITISSTTAGAWDVRYGPDLQQIPYKGWIGAGGSDGDYNAAPHHVALTHDHFNDYQSVLQLYLNSTLRAQWFVDTSSMSGTTEPLFPPLLGACQVRGRGNFEGAGLGVFRTRFFHGYVDEVRFWQGVRSPAEVQTTYQWSGPSTSWPSVIQNEFSALSAQYSFDVLKPRLHDGSGNNAGGWLGTEGAVRDSPLYANSPFQDPLQGGLHLGSALLGFRAHSKTSVEMLTYVYSPGIAYNALRVVRIPTDHSGGVELYVPGGTTPLSNGDLVVGTVLQIKTNQSASYDTFAVQPCRAFQDIAPNLDFCDEARVFEVSIYVEPSVPPIVGPVNAVQLQDEGAFIRLPPPQTATITTELWFQLTTPINMGATLFSINERQGANTVASRVIKRLWFDPFAGGAVLDICTNDQSEPLSFWIPGMAIADEAQHLAISFEREPGDASNGVAWKYQIRVHQNCILLLDVTVDNPCYEMNSPQLWPPTLGQHYVPDEIGARGAAEPWSQQFSAMYVNEVRMWNRSRDAIELCADMNSRLQGNETGLLAYMPISSLDATTATPLVKQVALSSGRVDQSASQNDAVVQLSIKAETGAVVQCALDYQDCPHVNEGVGFAIRPSPIDLPPNVVTVATASIQPIELPLVAHDPDNYADHSDEILDKDFITFEILSVPNPVCGYLYGKGENLRILEAASRATFGLSSTTLVPASQSPLTFRPFQGTTVTEVQALGGVCSTSLRYRAIDSQGLVSKHEASIDIHILRPGVQLISVNLSDPSGTELGLASVGGLLRFVFSGPTSELSTSAEELFQVSNGSWGSAPLLRSTWVANGTVLLVELGKGTGLDLHPGQTRFQVRRSALLQKKGDSFSAPCESLSPPLSGTLTQPSCERGAVLNFATGQCDQCTPGDYWHNGSIQTAGFPNVAKCLPCPGGTYEWRFGALSCLPCSEGTFLPENSTNRTACVLAQPGYHVPRTGMSLEEPCIIGSVAENNGQHQCAICPANADCRTPDRENSLAVAVPGYFRSGNEYHRCRLPLSCLGSNKCSADGQDPLLGCYPCPNGKTRGVGALRDRSKCADCPSDVEAISIAVAVFVGTALFAMYLASLNLVVAQRPACLHPFMLKIGLGHLLMMNSLLMLEEWELKDTFAQETIVHQLLSVFLGWDGMMPLHIIPVDCFLMRYTDLSTENRLWVELAIWPVLPFLFVLFCYILSLLVLIAVRPLGCLCGKGSQDESLELSPMGVVPKASLTHEATPQKEIADWRMVYSAEHKQFFYYNSSTGASSWTEPVKDEVTFAAKARQSIHDAAASVVSATERRVLGIWRVSTFREPLRRRFVLFTEDTRGILILALVLTYPPVLKQMMAFLRCDSLAGENHMPRLLVAPELACNEVQTQMLAAWFLLLLWGFGLPFFCMWLVYPYRRRLGKFDAKVRVGVISAEYEFNYYFWDALVLLRRFAVVSVATLAPGAPHTLRFALLLVIGVVAAFLQVFTEPFHNRSGLLLDVLELRGLSIFCFSTIVMLVTARGLFPPLLCTLLALIVLALHVLFLAMMLVFFIAQVQRSVTESVVDRNMANAESHGCSTPFHWISERIFMFEMGLRKHRAKVRFDPAKNALLIEPGTVGAEVTDSEQDFVAHGIADCVAHLIEDCHVERLSLLTLEYLIRQAFLNEVDRLRYTERVRETLTRKFGAGHSGGDQVDEQGPAMLSPKAGRQSKKDQMLTADRLFYPEIFRLGMTASDFQGALIEISFYSKERLDFGILSFLNKKGLDTGGYTLSTRDRLLSMTNVARAKANASRGKSKSPTRTPKTDSTPGNLSSPGEVQGLPITDKGVVDSLRVTDLEAPASLEMGNARDPIKTSEGLIGRFLAGEEAESEATITSPKLARETPELPQPDKVCLCKNGHRLILVAPSDSGWVCDAGPDLGECLSGVTEFFQSEGLNRFECRVCDYDICERCHNALLKIQQAEEDEWVPAQLPGQLPEDEEVSPGLASDQYRPSLVGAEELAVGGKIAASSSAPARPALLQSRTTVVASRGGAAGSDAPLKKLRESKSIPFPSAS